MRMRARAVTAVVTIAVLAGVTACGSSGGNSPKTGGSDVNSKALATFAALSGKSTSVKFVDSFTSDLSTYKVTQKPLGKATFDSATNTLSLPITGGSATFYRKGAATPDVTGTFQHAGSGLTLTAGKDVVSLDDLVVTLGKSPGISGTVLLNGKPFGASLTLFDIDDSTQQSPTRSGDVVTATGATVYVSTTAAGALNAVLNLTGKNALPTTKDSFKVGVLTVVASGK